MPWNLALAGLIGLSLLFTRVTLGAEGVMAHAHHIEMPICEAVDAVLGRGADLDAAIAGLLARPIGTEAD